MLRVRGPCVERQIIGTVAGNARLPDQVGHGAAATPAAAHGAPFDVHAGSLCNAVNHTDLVKRLECKHAKEQCKKTADGRWPAICRIRVYGGNRYRIADSPMKPSMNHARRRALWLLRRALRAQKPGATRLPLAATTLDQLKSSGRPLLFALLPRMLRGDGRTADALRNDFRTIENDRAAAPAVTVSRWRWNRTLARSRRIARRRRR